MPRRSPRPGYDGEVLLSESGRTKYRLTLPTASPAKAPPRVDYWARLQAYQPVPLTPAQARALHADNRGESRPLLGGSGEVVGT